MKHKYLILTILWMIIIFLFSSQSGDMSNMNNVFILDILQRMGVNISNFISYETANFIARKAAHFTEYFILGFLLFKTFSSYLYRGYGTASIITGFLYACSDEFHQYFVPGRGPAFKDVLIDTAGVVFGVALLLTLHFNRQRTSNLQA